MEIYIKAIENKIIDVKDDYVSDYEKLEVRNKEDLYQKIINYSLSDDIINQIEELFNDEEKSNNKKVFNIKHWVSNRSFGELIDMYDCGEIIKPDMQRKFVWDSKKCSRLIESILFGLPIPPLFMMEVDSNKYELIDGFQRLTTLFNFVKGYPWYGKTNEKRGLPAKLSNCVMEDINGKTFSKLSDEQQRCIKRSTIPLIEFKQLNPDDYESKYMIFERINTGSEKLNAMQIRKSLAHGTFMHSLYDFANNNSNLMSLFPSQKIKQDSHVEALLRVYAMRNVIAESDSLNMKSLVDILNSFCTIHSTERISDDFFDAFNKSLEKLKGYFSDQRNICRSICLLENDEYRYCGTINIAIFESIMGVMIDYKLYDIEIINFEDRYIKMLKDVILEGKDGEKNPFSEATGSYDSISRRFNFVKKMLGVR